MGDCRRHKRGRTADFAGVGTGLASLQPAGRRAAGLIQPAEGREWMAEKLLGPAGSKRRKRFLWVPTLLIACIALFVIGNAQAVHDLQFQLDGNTATSCGTVPHCVTTGTGAGQIYDWDSLFNADGSTTSLVNASNTSGFTQ